MAPTASEHARGIEGGIVAAMNLFFIYVISLGTLVIVVSGIGAALSLAMVSVIRKLRGS